jgi:VWFA-related protein
MGTNRGVPAMWRFAFAFTLLLSVSGALAASPRAFGQAGGQGTVPSTESQPAFQLKARSNLVVVHVVVRNAEGKPVEGLRKEDFKVFDRGKEQAISQFEVETSTPLPSTTAAVSAPAGPVVPPPAPVALPAKFLALYFDDLDTSDTDMIYAREAADRYLAANLQPQDRVAIFTSGKMLSDFTANPQQIHAALALLRADVRSVTRSHECPDLTDYQAVEMTEQENTEYSDAWQTALDDAVNRCKMGTPIPGSASSATGDPEKTDNSMLVGTLRIIARGVAMRVQMQARANLLGLEQVVNYIAQMPGQRTIVLVSPGFLSKSEKYSLDRIIDHAVRSLVVINSLDPRGLVPPRQGDASQQWISGRPGAVERVDSQREIVIADVLEELAQDSGGEFFRNNNDLKAGFAALTGSPVSYVLAFAPADIKADGKFHALKVSLVEKHKGFSVQARRGYFAPRNEADAAAEAKREAAADIETQAQEQIREAILSKTDSEQLPVGMGGKLSEGHSGGIRELSLIAHLDAKPLHFQKSGDHNLNTVTFVFAIFDQKENLIVAQQRQAFVKVLDSQLPELFKVGVDMDMNFQLKPGVYRIREVVADSEDHHLAALSRKIEVP